MDTENPLDQLQHLSDEELIDLVTSQRDTLDDSTQSAAESLLKDRGYDVAYKQEDQEVQQSPGQSKFFGTWRSLMVLSALGFLRVMLKGLDSGSQKFTLVLSLVTLLVAIYMAASEKQD